MELSQTSAVVLIVEVQSGAKKSSGSGRGCFSCVSIQLQLKLCQSTASAMHWNAIFANCKPNVYKDCILQYIEGWGVRQPEFRWNEECEEF